MFYAISACLAGENCKYSGGNNRNEAIVSLCESRPCVLICPERTGGLKTPRAPAEIIGGTGEDVLAGQAKVMDSEGRDRTEAFMKGALLSLAQVWEAAGDETEICAVLKAKSPSCGSGLIYDGTFSGTKIPGNGVTAALFKREGIRVLTEEEFVPPVD
ncbi:MAG: DUF523 domain-containing protein [Firmicutes bacterium]|nr:DUF523 domain-containing protein [Bacillota bacterium]MBR6503552.1 DUF523 domain-containing protein [Bacillota bacterium]